MLNVTLCDALLWGHPWAQTGHFDRVVVVVLKQAALFDMIWYRAHLLEQ